MLGNTEKKALKLFVVNSNVCNATALQEETLQGYDMIVINAATLITNPASRALIARYPVTMNVAAQADLDTSEAVEVSAVNGKSRIHPGMVLPERKLYLSVNGKLEIEPGSEAVLKHYCGMTVNGTIICPESVAPLLGRAQVNGSIQTYPDDCVRLKNIALLDRAFALRARPDTRYHSARCMAALDPMVDYAALGAKGVQLVTPELLVAEGLAQAAVPLTDEKTEVILLPDGCAFVADSAVLDEALVRRYGKKLYINGDLTVNKASAPWLTQLEYLQIRGDARVVRNLMEAFTRTEALYGKLCLTAETVITDRISVKVDAAMLENSPGGLELVDCVNVSFDREIPAELLRERLVALTDCVNVCCTAAQRSTIDMVARDVVNITEKDGKKSAVQNVTEQWSGAAGKLGEMLAKWGIDLKSVDIMRTLLGSRMINGDVCQL